MSLYVGTSGWAYPEWKPAFYPAELPRRRFLEHYASVFGACEINASFYQLQDEDTFRRWRAETGEHFRFAVKAHRRLTHFRRAGPIADRLAFLPGFMASLGPLGDRVGPVLFQFPPTTPRDDDLLARLLDALPHHHDYAFEFRDGSW
ncbi:MAG: DUF72 domain-containing protein, partial [Actinomycetota bacterium]|nr:DUF72 domain-containing protein [Actinomycetota bacterium]